MKKLSPAVAIWLAWFITAANLVVAKYAVPYVTSALFLFFSCVGAVLCFVPYLNRTGGWKLLLDKKLFWQYLGLGTLGTALPMTVFMIALNSFKKATAISTTTAFDLLTPETFNGLANYVHALNEQGFASAFMYSLIITVTSVVLILVCCSMCAWYVVRVNSKISNFFYYLFVFSMVVPFQMLMFTLSNLADRIGFNTPFNICFIYLGFGAGLAVFMFAGFVKNIPLEIEEAAMIDGCNPVQVFFKIVLPIMKPTYISVGILETMWIWNDFLLPYLVIGISTKYKTIPVVVQYLVGSYGAKDLGAMMALLVLSVIPIIVFYLTCQKYIIEGVVAGAVKG